MEQNNKKFYIIIAVLVGVIMLLIGLILGMFINLKLPVKNAESEVVSATSKEDRDFESSPIEIDKNDTPISEADLVKEIAEEKKETIPTVTKKDGALEIAYSGYQFLIPDDYGVMFEDYGPVVYMNGVFQLRLVVKEENAAAFKAHESNMAELTEKAVANGWEITKDCKKYTIEGKDYYIFHGETDGEEYIVFRTQIDNDNIFAGNMAVLDSSLKDEDYYKIFVTLTKSITKTDKPDTTEEEYDGAKYSVDVGEAISEKEIESNYINVTYKVPSLFYLTDSSSVDEDDICYYSDSYMTNNYDMADVRIQKMAGGAKHYVNDEGRYVECEHKSFEKNGYTFYYAEREGTSDDFYIQSILLATDLKKDGWIYVVDIYSDTDKYSLDDLAEFFIITEK